MQVGAFSIAGRYSYGILGKTLEQQPHGPGTRDRRLEMDVLLERMRDMETVLAAACHSGGSSK